MDTQPAQCPYCHQLVDLYVDPETTGTYVEDCAICCRPWTVTAHRDPDGNLQIQISRAQ